MSTPALLPHRRRNPLTDEWVLCSPHRATRPWLGQREAANPVQRPPHDPTCHLCARNTRANGAVNPNYGSTFVFDNDFRAMLDESGLPEANPHPLLESAPVRGTNRVICFSPRHDLSLAQMAVDEIVPVIATWVRESRELGARYRWVQVFENKGAVMGCSNPHPHGQIWASDVVPTLPAMEDRHQRAYFTVQGRPLLADYAELEIRRAERIVCQNDDWVVVVPYWATWPYETLLLPRFPVSRLAELAPGRSAGLATVLRELLVRYDNLFGTEFPYSMGWHSAPFDGADPAPWRLHAHFYPPLLRSATVKKFMVGYEMLAEAQRDITPEAAAASLRAQPTVRFDQEMP